MKIEFGNCAEAKGRQRLCVAGQPGAQRWGTEQAFLEFTAELAGLLFGDCGYARSRSLAWSLSVGLPVALRALLFELLGEAFLFTAQLREPLIFRYEIL